MEVFGIALTIISLILAYQAWQNGKWMKQAHKETMAMVQSIKEMTEQIREDGKRSSQETKALLERMDKNIMHSISLLDRVEQSISHSSQETKALLERMEQHTLQSSQETKALLDRMEQSMIRSSQETKALLERIEQHAFQSSQEAREILSKMNEYLVKIDERIMRSEIEFRTLLEQIYKGQEEARKEFSSAIKYIADLIVADGEKTRELLRSKT